MKNTLLLLLAATTLALGVVCIVQWQQRDAQQSEFASLRREVEQKSRDIADLEAAQELLAKQRRESLEQVGALAGKLQEQRQATAQAEAKAAAALANAAPKPVKGKGGVGELLAKMMDDPAMAKVIRDQQRTMMDSLYNPLVKRMNLTPEEAAQFKDLLADYMTKGATQATSLLGGESATNRLAVIEKLAAEQKDFDKQVRAFLGDSRFAEYRDYQQTAGERMQLNQFQMQNMGGQSALTEPQTEQLLNLMKEEKQVVAAAYGLPMPESGHDAAQLQIMLSEGGTEKIQQAQETINQRVYERAREVLSTEQLEAFGKFQTNQLHTMRLGMNMARKFMASE